MRTLALFVARSASARREETPEGSIAKIALAMNEDELMRVDRGALIVGVPQGRHRWQLSAGLPMPVPPAILRTVNRSGAAQVFVGAVPGAASYRFELSSDGGRTWKEVATTADATYTITGLTSGAKVHVRAIALNAAHSSGPGNEYPIYPTADAPPPPDGLKLSLSAGRVDVTWGETFGAGEYRLYRRIRGEKAFTLVCDGLARECVDRAAGVVPAFAEPGQAENAFYSGKPYAVYEYAVAAVNGNGEGSRSAIVDTDPASWANWDPKPGEPFRRKVVHNTLPADSHEGMSVY